MQVELSDEGKYSVIGLGSISFHMPIREILEFHEVLYVPGMTNYLLSISCLTNLKQCPKFDDQGLIIKGHSPDLGGVLARGVCKGGLYMLKLVQLQEPFSGG
jgi:hypothetical protein